jgi:methionyl-tRNA formyltransferase
VPIAFLGTTDFAAAVLAELAATEDLRPALVVTRPDRPRGRGRRLSPPPVAVAAKGLELPLLQPGRVGDEEARARIARAVDAGTVVVCAFGALIREPLLSEHEILNVHPSLLPRWRGAAPIERAIMAGDAETGVTIMRLTAGLDSGPVCLAAAAPIDAGETYGALATRLERLGSELIIRALRERPLCHEQEVEGVTYAEKIGPEDRLLDPARPAVELERVVRALHPHIGARVELRDGTHLRVEAAAISTAALEDGSGVVAADGRLLLRCSPGTLELLVVRPPGGRAMDAAAYLRGRSAPGLA